MKQYFYNILVAVSHLFNALLLGDPHDSISVRTGRAMEYDDSRWYRHHATFIDWLFFTLFDEKNHVRESATGEAKAKELWSWTKEK